MKKITNISTILLLLISSTSFGQITLGRQVVGSTGGFATGTNISVSSTVGEPVVQTKTSANLILTQGFQQTFKGGDSIATAEIVNESCRGANNGSIEITNVLGCPPSSVTGEYQLVIKPVNDTTVTLPNDSLATGDYFVVIIGNNGCVYSLTLFVGVDSDEDCLLKFYSGITPNGDGVNDVWWIDNIDQFPENTVQIFNRWGEQVWYGENYDNVDVVWKGNNGNGDTGDQMADGTYFYVARVEGIDNVFRGWVELTR